MRRLQDKSEQAMASPENRSNEATSSPQDGDGVRDDRGRRLSLKPGGREAEAKDGVEAPPNPGPDTVDAPKKSPLRPLMFALLPLALVFGAYWYVTGGQVVSMDDAYVEADKVGISTDVPGTVTEVGVTENQHVQAGQILYRL